MALVVHGKYHDPGRALPPAGVELDELVDDLSCGTGYHWRVRLRYHPPAPLQGLVEGFMAFFLSLPPSWAGAATVGAFS